jgi:hypothetical protein
MQTPERLPSPVRKSLWECGVVLGYSNSERTQQYGANESEHGQHRQHIEPQGKVHVICSLLLKLDLSLAESSVELNRQMYCTAEIISATSLDGQVPVANILIFRGKIIRTMIVDDA